MGKHSPCVCARAHAPALSVVQLKCLMMKELQNKIKKMSCSYVLFCSAVIAGRERDVK